MNKLANQPNKMAKRKKRIAALRTDKPRKVGLSTDRLKRRLEVTQSQLESLQIESSLCQQTPIYCNKTGAIIGFATEYAQAVTKQLGLSSATMCNISNNSVHPAWIDTSHEKLRDLQRMMPHEYVNYCAHYLWLPRSDAAEKNQTLQALYNQPLASIVEAAELLRIAIGLCGRGVRKVCHSYAKISQLTDANGAVIYFDGDNLPSFNEQLREWLRATIDWMQQSVHSHDIDRARCITANDVKNIYMELGIANFRQARIGSAEDDTALIDLVELFGQDEQFSMALKYQKPAPKERKHSGKVLTAQTATTDDIDLDAIDDGQSKNNHKQTQLPTGGLKLNITQSASIATSKPTESTQTETQQVPQSNAQRRVTINFNK